MVKRKKEEKVEKKTEKKVEEPKIKKEEKVMISKQPQKELDNASYLSRILIWTFAVISGIFVIATIIMILLDKNGDIDEFIELYRNFIVPVAALLGASFGYSFTKNDTK